MGRRILIASTFASCCFAGVWIDLARATQAYHLRVHPWGSILVPTLACEIVIAACLLMAWAFLGSRGRAARYGFIAASAVPLGIAAAALARVAPPLVEDVIRSRLFWPAAAAALLPALWAVLRFPRSVAHWIAEAFLCLSPVVALVYGEVAWKWSVKYSPSSYREAPSAGRLPASPASRRVVWIIFDAMGEQPAFLERPPTLSLPAFDRLRGESLDATGAYSPSTSTEYSLPSLLTGLPVAHVEMRGPAALALQTEAGGAPKDWKTLPNVFDRARELGVNSALVGWYHPYSRLFNNRLAECFWTPEMLPAAIEGEIESQPFSQTMLDRARYAIADMPVAGHFAALNPDAELRARKSVYYRALIARALQAVADPSLGLVFLHLPVPHPPGIFDRDANRLIDGNYFDNLELADRTLASLEGAIEQSGLAGRTALLISADHGWRPEIWRGRAGWTAEEERYSQGLDSLLVPFILHLPGQRTGLSYPHRMETVHSSALVLDLLQGRIGAAGEAADWLERHSGNGSDTGSQ